MVVARMSSGEQHVLVLQQRVDNGCDKLYMVERESMALVVGMGFTTDGDSTSSSSRIRGGSRDVAGHESRTRAR